MSTIVGYKGAFSSLHVAKSKGVRAPHKAILLLSVIDLVEEGIITNPFIELTDTLVTKFNSNWDRYVGNSSVFTSDIGKPYYHLQHEPFWRLIARDKEDDTKEGESVSYSLKSLRERFSCAVIDQSLFEYIQQPDHRAELRVVLISEYLTNHPRTTASVGVISMLIGLLGIVG